MRLCTKIGSKEPSSRPLIELLRGTVKNFICIYIGRLFGVNRFQATPTGRSADGKCEVFWSHFGEAAFSLHSQLSQLWKLLVAEG